MLLIVAALLFAFFSLLSVITGHGKSASVPDLKGKTLQEAISLLEKQGFAYSIQDSVYLDSIAPLTVIRQAPDAAEVVKQYRTVYLTVNRKNPPLVEMPDLRGFSLRSAEMLLQSLGLKLGDTSFVPDIARNAIKEQKWKGNPIEPGMKVSMGSYIDLVLGSGVGDDEFEVPDLTGLTYAEAVGILESKQLGLGALVVLDAVKDTSSAFVVRQHPEVITTIDDLRYKNRMRSGQLMDLYISVSPPADSSVVIE